MNWYAIYKTSQEIFRGDKSPISIDEWNPDYSTKVLLKDLGSSSAFGPGLYFVTAKDIAESYGQYITSKKLNNAKILTHNHPKFTTKQIVKMLEKIDKNILNMAASNWDEDYNRGINIVVSTIAEENNPIDQIFAIWAEVFQHQNPIQFIKSMIDNGIDGISKKKNGDIFYVIYNKNILI